MTSLQKWIMGFLALSKGRPMSLWKFVIELWFNTLGYLDVEMSTSSKIFLYLDYHSPLSGVCEHTRVARRLYCCRTWRIIPQRWQNWKQHHTHGSRHSCIRATRSGQIITNQIVAESRLTTSDHQAAGLAEDHRAEKELKWALWMTQCRFISLLHPNSRQYGVNR